MLGNGPSDIERQLAQVRKDLQGAAEDARHHASEYAQQMTDWRYHVRRHPWLAMAAAVAVGYVVVPRAKRSASGGDGTAEESRAPQGKAVSAAAPAWQMMLGAFLNHVGSVVARSAVDQVVRGAAGWSQRLSAAEREGRGSNS
ncbi:MAG: hypothetical protein ACOY3P_17320 [Planctomycetota bacterium]